MDSEQMPKRSRIATGVVFAAMLAGAALAPSGAGADVIVPHAAQQPVTPHAVTPSPAPTPSSAPTPSPAPASPAPFSVHTTATAPPPTHDLPGYWDANCGEACRSVHEQMAAGTWTQSNQPQPPDAITGVGSIISDTDLGTWDMFTPLDTALAIVSGSEGNPMDVLAPLMELFGVEGTTTCSQKTDADGRVQVCVK